MAKEVAVRMLCTTTVGLSTIRDGEIVGVLEGRAAELVAGGHAEYVDGPIPPKPPIDEAVARIAAHLGQSVEDFEKTVQANQIEHEVQIVEEKKRGRGGPRPGSGRPKSEIELGRTSIYRDLLVRASFVADARKISIHKYLSEALRPIVNADFLKANEDLES